MSDVNQLINTAGGILETAAKSLPIVETIFQAMEQNRLRNTSIENMLRTYYMEVTANIEFLKLVNFKELRREPANSRRFRLILANLCNDVALRLLFHDQNTGDNDMYRFLQKQGEIKNVGKKISKVIGGTELRTQDKVIYEHVLQAVSFTVVKLDALKKLSSYDDLDMLRTIFLDVRLENLLQRYLMIQDELGKMPMIASMAR